MALVSVLLPIHKEPLGIIKQSLDSILCQSFFDFEIIAILDCPDNADALFLLSEYSRADARIRILRNEKNIGLTRSLNRGIKVASGEYICRMDADDISLENRLEKQLDYLRSNQLDLIGGCMLVIDDLGHEMYRAEGIPTSPDAVNRALRWNNCVPHPTWFGKRAVFENGYRQIPLCEDYDFLIRAVLAGFRIGNIDSVILKYRMSSGSISRSNLYEQFLYQRYLSKSYAIGEVVEIDAAKAYIERHKNRQRAANYNEANRRFNEILQGDRGIFLRMASIPGLVIALLRSFGYCEKVARLCLARLAALK